MPHHMRLNAEETKDFITCWNNDMAFERMQTRFFKNSINAVKHLASSLRKKGFEMKDRRESSIELKMKTDYYDKDGKPTSRHPWKQYPHHYNKKIYETLP